MSAIDDVTRELGRLPGIGPRTANRLAYHLLRGSPDEARRLSRAILALVERIRPCTICGNFTEGERCEICKDPERDGSVICVVEGAFELRSIDRTGEYRGLFHVLGGRLSPLDGIGPEELRLAPLIRRIQESEGGVREVILATNPSVEGEATAVYLEGLIRPLGPRVTRLARGIPVGGDLEYVDGSTLAEALSGRREM
ncbi:MAG: recombination mediator RecR [Gemmatimonadota bacterium]